MKSIPSLEAKIFLNLESLHKKYIAFKGKVSVKKKSNFSKQILVTNRYWLTIKYTSRLCFTLDCFIYIHYIDPSSLKAEFIKHSD